MTLQRTLIVSIALAMAGSVAAAQTKKPDFSGNWQEDLPASKALTEKNGGVWRVAGATSGGAPSANANVLLPITTIAQSPTELVIERRYDTEVTSHEVYKLDGSESLNVSRNSTSRTRTVWKGNSLVTSGTTQFDFTNGQATSADGKPINSLKRDSVTTRTLMPDGTMQVETQSTQEGDRRTSWYVLVRVKPS